MIQVRVPFSSFQGPKARKPHALVALALITAISVLPHSIVLAQDKKPAFTPTEARLFLRSTSDALLAKRSEDTKSFEAFRKSVTKEPFQYGKYIVNGDTPILDIKELEQFYKEQIVARSGNTSDEFAIMRKNGVDIIWDDQKKKSLTYCVSNVPTASGGFGDHYDAVVAAMAEAAKAWEQAADVKFVHVAAEDFKCNATSAKVMFDVRPVKMGAYLARAFFPNDPRTARNVLVDSSALELPAGGKLSLIGILRHELGHTLGARHEHTRPEAGICFEDNDWRGVTDYDAMSVMHYPQCNGKGDWSLALTDKDKTGIACMYKQPGGVPVDPGKCAK